jgi:hypothetical protein
MPAAVCNASFSTTCPRKPNSIQNASSLANFLSGVLNSQLKFFNCIYWSSIHKLLHMSPYEKIARVQIWRPRKPQNWTSTTYPTIWKRDIHPCPNLSSVMRRCTVVKVSHFLPNCQRNLFE